MSNARRDIILKNYCEASVNVKTSAQELGMALAESGFEVSQRNEDMLRLGLQIAETITPDDNVDHQSEVQPEGSETKEKKKQKKGKKKKTGKPSPPNVNQEPAEDPSQLEAAGEPTPTM
jgi:hypothetical protein